MLGRGKIAEMEVVVHERAVASLGARMGDRDFGGSTGNSLYCCRCLVGVGWGGVGVQVVRFIHSLRFPSLCQTDQPHSFLL